MNDLPRIKAAYERIIDLVQKEIAESASAGDRPKERQLAEALRVVEYAFFVLCFAQFEREINRVFEQAYRRRIGNADWSKRRGWDLDDYSEAQRVRFKDRVTMVIDRRSEEHGRILQNFATRNHIAHGGLTERIAPIDIFINDLFVLAGKLKS